MINRVLKLWIITSFVIFVSCVASYLATQQNYRQSANDPQEQIVQDIGNKLNVGISPKDTFSYFEPIDMSKSLSPFVYIYSEINGSRVASNANLNGKVPDAHTFFSSQYWEVTNFTWEPQKGVRLAVVGERFGDYFVISGRSLREVENRIHILTLQFVVGFVGAVILDFIVILVIERLLPEKRK